MSGGIEPSKDRVSVEIAARDGSLQLAARARTISALDSLFGNIIGIGSAYFARHRLNLEAKARKIIEESSTDHTLKVTNIEKIVEINQGIDSCRRAENKSAIYERITEILNSAPASISTPSSSNTENLSDDWMTNFVERAEKAQSERMRSILASIFVQEIAYPGSISLATLRTISEMSPSILDGFRHICKFRLSRIGIPAPESFIGQTFIDLLEMENLGLISGVQSSISTEISEDKISEQLLFCDDFAIDLSNFSFNSKIEYRAFILSNSGLQLANLTKAFPESRSIIFMLQCIATSPTQARLLTYSGDRDEVGRLIMPGPVILTGEKIIQIDPIKVLPTSNLEEVFAIPSWFDD